MKVIVTFIGMFFRLIAFTTLFLIAYMLLVVTCQTWGVSPPPIEGLTPFAVIGFIAMEVGWMSEG
jgi:hypothetical protein